MMRCIGLNKTEGAAVKTVFVVCILVFGLQGCASIVSGTTQSVSVETKTASGNQIPGANCKMTNDKGTWFVNTPGTVPLHRSGGDLVILCTKDAFDPASHVERSTTKGLLAGNILFGGLIGVGVDTISGAAFDYPDLVSIPMGPSSGQPVTRASTFRGPPALAP